VLVALTFLRGFFAKFRHLLRVIAGHRRTEVGK
jgi:hypothetical protein